MREEYTLIAKIVLVIIIVIYYRNAGNSLRWRQLAGTMPVSMAPATGRLKTTPQ